MSKCCIHDRFSSLVRVYTPAYIYYNSMSYMVYYNGKHTRVDVCVY